MCSFASARTTAHGPGPIHHARLVHGYRCLSRNYVERTSLHAVLSCDLETTATPSITLNERMLEVIVETRGEVFKYRTMHVSGRNKLCGVAFQTLQPDL